VPCPDIGYHGENEGSAIGPGLSINDHIIEIVGGIIENAKIPLVLDADALNAVAKDIVLLRQLKTGAVVTPHPGEMSRLTGLKIPEIQEDRIGAAKDFACKWGVVTVLKGSKTVVALPDGRVYINPTGNSGMATGGSGDVLTGVIAGLISQGMELGNAAIAGVYIHGAAGDAAADKMGEHGMIASDITEEIPYIIKSLVPPEASYKYI
jgi:NAD(P)H-hydrate epimerase